jgi:hypothetical protein
MTDQTRIRASSLGLVGVLGLLAGATTAQAATVNLLTSGSSGTLNGALFETIDLRSSGTGVIDPFLRMQRNGTEQGYNTSGRPVAFDELTDPNFTRDLLVGELGTRIIDGTSYYEFLLDVNEPNGGGQELISLERLQLYTGATGSLTTTNLSELGTLRFDLDAGDATNLVRINDLNTGSGEYDVRILIPVSALAGALATDYLYFFARFGDTDASAAGFEEFAALTNAVVIPLPTGAGLGLAGLGLVALRRRR